MTTISNIRTAPGFFFAGLSLALGGCHSSDTIEAKPKPQPAAMTSFVDLSGSTIFMSSPAYTDAAIEHVGQAVMKQRLGDRFRIVGIGTRSADNAVDVLSITSGYQHRLPDVRKRVTAALSDLIQHNRQTGGQGATNITYSMFNAHPTCTPASTILVLSDGIEESETYSASRTLAAGQPVHLPSPATPYLKGCSVQFIAIGMAPISMGQSAQTLPDAQLQALIAGWREYLTAAGVAPADMSFTSIL